jgi:hypothetical protein
VPATKNDNAARGHFEGFKRLTLDFCTGRP